MILIPGQGPPKSCQKIVMVDQAEGKNHTVIVEMM